MIFRIMTLWMRPGPGSVGLGGSLFHSLGVLISKLNGLPSPAQNQSKRCRWMVRLEMITSRMKPPATICKVIPRLQLVMTQLSITTFRMPTLMPSVNLIAADAEENRQFVIVMFSAMTFSEHRDAIVSGLDGAVGDSDILAPVDINTIRPHSLFEAGISVNPIDHHPFTLDEVKGPTGRAQERQPRDAHVFAASQPYQMGIDVASGKAFGIRPHDRFAQRDHQGLMVESMLGRIRLPDIFRLAVHSSPAFDRNVFKVIPLKQGGGGWSILLIKREDVDERVSVGVIGGIQRRAPFEVQPHMAAELETSGRILARRQIDGSSATPCTSIDGFLDRRRCVVAFSSGCPVSLHIEDGFA